MNVAAEHRAALVRAVVGQQWAVAVTVCGSDVEVPARWMPPNSVFTFPVANESYDVRARWFVAMAVADLPCAVDVVWRGVGDGKKREDIHSDEYRRETDEIVRQMDIAYANLRGRGRPRPLK